MSVLCITSSPVQPTLSCPHHVCSIPWSCQWAKGPTSSPFLCQSSCQKDLAFRPKIKNTDWNGLFSIVNFQLSPREILHTHTHTYLLHMSKDILPAVKYTLSFLWVQVKDEVRCVVGIALLISVTRDKYWMQCNTVPQWAAANNWFCQDWKRQQSPQTSEWVLSSLWSSSSPPDVPRSTMNKRQINTANRLPLAEVLLIQWHIHTSRSCMLKGSS